MSKREDLIDEYMDLCDRFGEQPHLDDDKEPDPYSEHARLLRKMSREHAVATTPQQQAPAPLEGGLSPTQMKMVAGLGHLVGDAIGKALGSKLEGLSGDMRGIREELAEGRKEQAQVRKQMAAGRGPMSANTDDEWAEHERNAQERFGYGPGGRR